MRVSSPPRRGALQHASSQIIFAISSGLVISPLISDDLFLGKPVLLFATGGLPGYVTILERALWHELVRLGTTTIAARVHIGTGSWITIGNDRLRLSRGAEQEVARAVDLILRRIRLNELRE
ncbi:MAG: hypothetical protein JO151_21480 [Verrucomicrobia bacterium]|nr:hypothetical protein [Verrucomicrobiota bacterium]